jgi:hypothetical protein
MSQVKAQRQSILNRNNYNEHLPFSISSHFADPQSVE